MGEQGAPQVVTRRASFNGCPSLSIEVGCTADSVAYHSMRETVQSCEPFAVVLSTVDGERRPARELVGLVRGHRAATSSKAAKYDYRLSCIASSAFALRARIVPAASPSSTLHEQREQLVAHLVSIRRTKLLSDSRTHCYSADSTASRLHLRQRPDAAAARRDDLPPCSSSSAHRNSSAEWQLRRANS